MHFAFKRVQLFFHFVSLFGLLLPAHSALTDTPVNLFGHSGYRMPGAYLG